jgi:DnaK suppressor protein
MEKNYLRKFKGYELHDSGPHEMGEMERKVEISWEGKYVHGIFYANTDINQLNKAIEKAKEWIKEHDGQEAKTSVRYSDDDLRDFRILIENKLEGAEKEIEYLRTFLTNPPEDQMEKEQMEQMVIRQQTYIDNLKAALTRIEDKSYGICKVTGNLIDKSRLRAVPHATLSSEVKQNDLKKEEEDVPPSIHEVKVDKCRVCGCTDEDCSQCIEKTGDACHWIQRDGANSLCSACVEEVKENVPEESETISPTTNTEIVMDFFKQLAGMGKVDLTMRIMQKDDKLSVSLFPSGKSRLHPIVVTGTPEELDDAFFNSIAPAVQEVKGLVSNIDEVKKAAAKKKETTKPDEKKATPKKKAEAKKSEPKKPAAKKSVKPAAKPKPAKEEKKQEEKPPPVEEVSVF